MGDKDKRLLVITRHKALIDLLLEEGIITKGEYEVLPHVHSPEEIRGKVVIGHLPLHLAVEAAQVITPVLELKPGDRGKELSLPDLRERFQGVRTYKVFHLEDLESRLGRLNEAAYAEGWPPVGPAPSDYILGE